MSVAGRDRPALSVIVVNWNVRELLREALTALATTTSTPA